MFIVLFSLYFVAYEREIVFLSNWLVDIRYVKIFFLIRVFLNIKDYLESKSFNIRSRFYRIFGIEIIWVYKLYIEGIRINLLFSRSVEL